MEGPEWPQSILSWNRGVTVHGFSHIHAYHEILAQAGHLERIAEESEALSSPIVEILKNVRPQSIHFVGCGSSYFLGLALSYHLKRLSGGKICSTALSGSEVMLGMHRFSRDTLLIGLTRSGNSTETIEALKKAKEADGVQTAAITCAADSAIASVVDRIVEMPFVVQRSVAMTGGYTATAFIAQLVFLNIFQPELLDVAKQEIPKQAKRVMSDSQTLIQQLSETERSALQHFSFLGYEEDFGIGWEGVIKLTEMALADVDAYQPLEYRHGPRAKTGPQSLVTLFSRKELKPFLLPLVTELKTTGATIIQTGEPDSATSVIHLPDLPYHLEWLLKVIPIHWLGLYKAVEKGLNPDQPQNLTQVVEIDTSHL